MLLAEQALYTNFGGPEVMKGQLDRLMTAMRLPRLSLGLIPRSARLAIWPGNSFSMFDDKLVLVETYSAEFSVTQPREIELYTKDRAGGTLAFPPTAWSDFLDFSKRQRV